MSRLIYKTIENLSWDIPKVGSLSDRKKEPPKSELNKLDSETALHVKRICGLIGTIIYSGHIDKRDKEGLKGIILPLMHSLTSEAQRISRDEFLRVSKKSEQMVSIVSKILEPWNKCT